MRARVEEVPVLVPGEEVYLFLRPAPDGLYRVLGWSQGAFRIRKDKPTGLERATQDPASVPLFDPVTRQFRLRVLYSNPSDLLHIGSIEGRVFPANTLSLPASPPGITGIFGAQVVAVDSESGSVMAGTIGGWSCANSGPAQFDGAYEIEKLPVGRSDAVYAEHWMERSIHRRSQPRCKTYAGMPLPT